MEYVIREYEDRDYQACEDLVGKTWRFSDHFRPSGFCDVAKYGYTRGSVIGSNFKRVIESDGRVVGFIFSRNERNPLEHGLASQLALNFVFIKRLLCVRKLRLRKKFAFLGILNQHELNRSKVEKRGASEINLFAIEKDFQGQGLGSRLMSQFIDDCKGQGVERVIVEVNVLQASGFYEKSGFVKIRDFVSPLHEISSGKGSMAALYEKILS